ncbi:MAG: long-chain fatty acid--CoA ligase [Planctomycetes bacterium]|nr:long-chain fatty acid--CoA ligase [Planctomycetota bacterium]
MPNALAQTFAELRRCDRHAVVAWTAAGPVTRDDLHHRAEARRRAGLPPAAGRVAISVRDGVCFLAAVLAVWQMNGCAVLLDAADPQAPRTDLAHWFGASCVVTDDAVLPVAAAGSGAAGADPFAAIKLTSGSTGMPRGIGVSAEALCADADQLEATMGIGAADRVFGAVPMSFSYGVGNLLVPAIARGRTLVLPDAQNPLGFLQAMRHGLPTVLPAVPALLRALLQNGMELPATLRLVLSAGALLPPPVAAAFRGRFGRPVHAFYGSTESGGICFDRTGTAAEAGTVGAPVDGVRVVLDDGGRVVVESPAVGTALDEVANPVHGRYVTADLGEWRGDQLALLGRAGDVFDVGGHKVHPREIEGIVAEVAGVDDVVVVPWRDRDGRAVCAALVAARGVDDAVLRAHCARRLPPAKVPRCIAVLPQLPRTDRGKLPRAEVERLLRAIDGGVGA